ncbi:MAG: hypothetical protein JW927_05570 [Deltaproteobacteria bacterium]|nr:hypothetical protein [Deltaproteobacteria bacterium]
MKILKSISLLIIAYMLVFPTPLSAEISPSQLEIIKIAFMNGYVNAINGDIQTIMALQQDQKKLQQYSTAAVENYMKKVTMLNLKDFKGKAVNKPEKAVSNSMLF